MRERNEDIISLVDLEIGFTGRGGARTSISGPLSNTLREGELVALMGVNGSGKSTLLRTISGLQKQLKGSIRIQGREVKEYPGREFAKILSYVSTEVVNVQGMRVEQLVSMGRYPHTNWFGAMTSEDYEMVGKALELTSLLSLSKRGMDELSDGERQRAMIARTLSQDTPVLMLDEPTAFLDISHKYEIIHLLRTLSRDYNKTIVFSTHDLPAALREADKIWLLNESEIVEGSPEDIVITGKLSDALLDESSEIGVSLDIESGEFRLQRNMHGTARISSSDEMLKAWTSKALERLGYNTQSNQSGGINVIVNKKDGILIWTLEKNLNKLEFKSIYELSLYLRTHV